MHANLEFRGRWLDIFGNVILIAILSTITAGIYAPWGYARWQRIITENTYYEDQPLEFDGSGGQVLLQFIIVAFFTIITLGLYVILGFSAARLLRWQYAHTLMPNGQRMEYVGGAIDIFWEKFLLMLFTPLTLGLYYFWGYNRLRRQILTSVSLEGQRWQYEGSGAGFFLVSLVNFLLSVITLGFYAVLGFATVRLLKWEVGKTLVPVPVRSPTPMPVISTPVSALTSGYTGGSYSQDTEDYSQDFTYQPDSEFDYTGEQESSDTGSAYAAEGSYGTTDSYETDTYTADSYESDAYSTSSYTSDAYDEGGYGTETDTQDPLAGYAPEQSLSEESDSESSTPDWSDVEPYSPQAPAGGEETEEEESNFWSNRRSDDET